jgi:C1A family cysteine protease
MKTPHSSRPNPRRTNKRPVRHSYGWVPDIPDQRDFLFRELKPAPTALPSSIDLRKNCSSVENQGSLGSCTANALAGALEYLEIKDHKPFVDLSRLFIYYNERKIEGTVATDSGAMLRDGVKALRSLGVCTEKLWPYTIGKFAVKPTAACYTDGLKRKVTSYHRILTLNEMLTCLAEGFPFVFGFTVYESLESAEVAQTGVVPMPKEGERVLGGHAVLAVGYDDSAKRFLVRNSWGTSWGQGGYFTMPFEYLENRNLSDDFWTIRVGQGL